MIFSAEDSGEAAGHRAGRRSRRQHQPDLVDLTCNACSAGSVASPLDRQLRPAQTHAINLDALVGIKGTKELKEAALRLLAIGDGRNSVFKVRQKEMDTVEYGELILDETRKLNVGLGMSVKQLVDKVRSETDAATTRRRRQSRWRRR